MQVQITLASTGDRCQVQIILRKSSTGDRWRVLKNSITNVLYARQETTKTIRNAEVIL
jgi:hypothetical protein